MFLPLTICHTSVSDVLNTGASFLNQEIFLVDLLSSSINMYPTFNQHCQELFELWYFSIYHIQPENRRRFVNQRKCTSSPMKHTIALDSKCISGGSFQPTVYAGGHRLSSPFFHPYESRLLTASKRMDMISMLKTDEIS